MAGKRFYGVDQDAKRAAHIAFAGPECGCFDCRATRAEVALERARRRFEGWATRG